MTTRQISEKRQFVRNGVLEAELNSFLKKELAEEGYSGVEVRRTQTRTEIIITAINTHNVLGEKGRRIRELKYIIQKMFRFKEGSFELYVDKNPNRGLCAIAQVEFLRQKLKDGVRVRKASSAVLHFIMKSGARGCEIVVAGKLKNQRAKRYKYVDGMMIHSGDPANLYIDSAVRLLHLSHGVVGIRITIMLPENSDKKSLPQYRLPDNVKVLEPGEEKPEKEAPSRKHTSGRLVCRRQPRPHYRPV